MTEIEKESTERIFFPGEWEEQDAVLLTWPEAGTDWAPVLNEAVAVYVEMSAQIARRQTLLIVARQPEQVRTLLPDSGTDNIRLLTCAYNDTWIRDYGPVTVFRDGQPRLLDFGFDGWGGKFVAEDDNRVTSRLFREGVFGKNAGYINMNHFILEGGSIETDGRGTLLTTTRCLLANSRNPGADRNRFEMILRMHLGAEQILWLQNGYLEGDDTDGHIDTLVRFCSPDTIAYVECTDPADPHYPGLIAMKKELMSMTDATGQPYNLVPLPMAEPIHGPDGNRLPATYANFLVINGAVLVPVYQTRRDDQALRIMEVLFPGREILPVDSRTLILQGGSIHCASMQLPRGVL